jgi:hypothetical protein
MHHGGNLEDRELASDVITALPPPPPRKKSN